MFQKVLVALDGSTAARQALQFALQIVREQDLDLWVVTVAEGIPRYVATRDEFDAEREEANRTAANIQNEAQTLANRQGTNLHRETLMGQPAKAIVDYAERERVDLLIVGHPGRSNPWCGILGANADKIVRRAHCTVMVVR